MIVAACVQQAKLVRLLAAAGTTHQVLTALDWEHADALIRQKPVDVLVVDPQFGSLSTAHASHIRKVRDRYRSLPMIVYASLAAYTLRPIVELGIAGFDQLILFGCEDGPKQIRALLERQPGIALAEDLLTLLAPALDRTPVSISRAIEHAVRNPAAFRGVPDLIKVSGISHRSLYRYFEHAGLTSPRDILVGARVLRAYAFLREPAYSREAVAAHLGFADTRAMTIAMKEAAGMTPARARKHVAPKEFLARLVATIAPAMQSSKEARSPLAIQPRQNSEYLERHRL